MILKLSLDLPEDLGFVRTARRLSRTLLEDLDVCSQDICDIETIVGELSANAIRHGESRAEQFHIHLEYGAENVVITVEDRGSGFAFKDVPQAGTERPERGGGERFGGYGIPLVDALADYLTFSRADTHGMRVSAAKKLHYNTPASAEIAARIDAGGKLSSLN